MYDLKINSESQQRFLVLYSLESIIKTDKSTEGLRLERKEKTKRASDTTSLALQESQDTKEN